MTITITPQELGTILAALRHWQTEIEDGDYPGDLWDIASDGGTMVPLDAEDIDLLCENLNCGPEEPEPVAVEKEPVKPDDQQLVREAVRILDLIHIPCPIHPNHQSAAKATDATAEHSL